MNDIRTSEALLTALRDSSSRTPSADQREKQRLSFVMGSLPEENDMTREQVQDILDQYEGRRLTLE